MTCLVQLEKISVESLLVYSSVKNASLNLSSFVEISDQIHSGRKKLADNLSKIYEFHYL
jgi:hypothetical protein